MSENVKEVNEGTGDTSSRLTGHEKLCVPL
jgi:hypothetical protein